MILGHLTFTTQVSPSFIDLSNYVNFQIGKKNRWTQKNAHYCTMGQDHVQVNCSFKSEFWAESEL